MSSKHEGDIVVQSREGKGTTFTIYLPASRDVSLASPCAEERLVHGEGRILVMDDEPFIRSLAFRMLEALGYACDTVNNGRDAVDAYRRSHENGKLYDAVILDLTVPAGMGGEEAIRELLRIDPDVKAIVSSGYADGDVFSDCGRFGFAAGIPKPYDIQTLSRILADVLLPG